MPRLNDAPSATLTEELDPTLSVESPFGSPDDGLDDTFDFNFQGIQTNSRLIPAGVYAVKLVALEKDTSRNGNKMWVWTVEIATGEYAGKQYKTWTALTPAAMWKVLETCEGFGLASQGEIGRFSLSDALGRLAAGVLVDGEYSDRTTGEMKATTNLDKIERLEAYPDLMAQVEQLVMAG